MLLVHQRVQQQQPCPPHTKPSGPQSRTHSSRVSLRNSVSSHHQTSISMDGRMSPHRTPLKSTEQGFLRHTQCVTLYPTICGDEECTLPIYLYMYIYMSGICDCVCCAWSYGDAIDPHGQFHSLLDQQQQHSSRSLLESASPLLRITQRELLFPTRRGENTTTQSVRSFRSTAARTLGPFMQMAS